MAGRRRGYERNKYWNDFYELKCLLILKQLEETETEEHKERLDKLAQQLESNSNLTEHTIKKKVQNYISVRERVIKNFQEIDIRGYNNNSFSTEKIFKKYYLYSISELEDELKELEKMGLDKMYEHSE